MLLELAERVVLAAARLPLRFVAFVEALENELPDTQHELDAFDVVELAQVTHQSADVGLRTRGNKFLRCFASHTPPGHRSYPGTDTDRLEPRLRSVGQFRASRWPHVTSVPW